MSYCIFADLETGGVEQHHPNIQFAAIAIDEQRWVEVAHFECKIKFDESKADPEALNLNHYERDAWKDAETPALVAARFAKWADPYKSLEMISKRTGKSYRVGKLAGHNIVTFDLPRIRSMFDGSFFPFSYHTKDTLQRAMWYFDENPTVKRPESLKLSVLCDYFGIRTDGAHDALADVRMSAALARAIALEEKRKK